MDLHIECPICEQRFTTPDVPLGEIIECPGCERKFDHTFDVELEPEEMADELGEDQSSYSNHLSVPNAYEAYPVARPVEKQSEYADTISAFHQLERKRRKRKRLIVTLFSSAILAGIIGVMIGMLLKQIKKNELANQLQTRNEVAIATGNDFGLAEHIANKQDSQDPEKQPVEENLPEPWVVPEVIPPQKFVYWTRNQVRDSWAWIHPHLVSLTVHDGLGTHQAVGTIVDSRGWILTSYSAIKGASKIEVRSGVGSVKQLADAELLTDLVRGYVEIDRDRDLAILAINRRFVIAFTFLELARRNRVVEQQYLIQCAPPGEHNLHGATEAQIIFRGTVGQLDTMGQKQVARRKIPGKELTWLKAQSATPPLPGSPLFNSANELSAINSFYVDRKGANDAYFVPADRAVTMIEETKGTVKPLSELGVGKHRNVVAVAENNPFREKIVELNRLAKFCSDFDWIPVNLEQYQTFQMFAERYMEIVAEAQRLSGSTIAEEQKIITLKNDLDETLRDRFIGLDFEDEKLLGNMNREFAETELQRLNRVVPFYGEVREPTGTQLKVRLYATTTETKVPFPTTGRAPKLDKKWLFFVKTRTGRGSGSVDSMLMIR